MIIDCLYRNCSLQETYFMKTYTTIVLNMLLHKLSIVQLFRRNVSNLQQEAKSISITVAGLINFSYVVMTLNRIN